MRERQKYTGRLLLTESPCAAFQVNRLHVSQASLNHTKPLTDKTSPHWNAVENSPLLIPVLMNGEKLEESKSLPFSLPFSHVLHLTHKNGAPQSHLKTMNGMLQCCGRDSGCLNFFHSSTSEHSLKLIIFALITWHQWACTNKTSTVEKLDMPTQTSCYAIMLLPVAL